MVTIIKNQLLKHLSRFTKNLSPEQISLSALRGSGELADLTLDEVLLTELLELPAWLRLTSATCNRATFRIQWTKLKTVPIMLNLDEVHVALAVCSEPRTASSSAPSGITAALPGKYSFIHKVIDGISVSVNLVQVHFNCDAFNASVQISRVTVESRTPQWARGDLRLTRIKSPDTGQLLIFKELEWQTARLEIKVRGSAAANLPPLRLLIGNSHCRIVIKKRLSDCSMIGSRLVLQPEPLAWALTDGQLRAALACVSALMEPVQKATTASTRAKAVRKIQVDSAPDAQPSRSSHGTERDALARLFARYDVRETSYHLLAPRIDLHLCDDPGLGRSEKPSLSNGGALQVSLLSMQADFFPYHKATNDRRHWKGYREAATPHSQWLAQSLSAFCGSLLEMLDPRPTVTPTSVNKEPNHMENKTEEAMANGVQNKPQQNQTHNQSNTTNTNSSNTNTGASPTRTRILQQLGKLMTTCLVLRIDDFTVYKVSTGQKSREPMRALVSAEKATLPGDAGLLHAELTHFYYPGDTNDFPVPPPKLYVQLSPVRVSVDVDSCVWLGAFMPHVGRALVENAPGEEMPFYMDVKMEAIMPKIVLEAGPEHVSQQRDRPKELQICAARATLTNVREPSRHSGAPGSRADLASILTALRQAAPPVKKFPRCKDDLEPINDKFILHADGLDDIERISKLHPELLWREARDVWCMRAEPAWADFCGAKATGNRPAPLLDAIPLTAWLSFDETFSKIWCVAKVWGLAGLQLNHYQLLFLLRQVERLSELTSWLAHDARRQPDADEGMIVVGVVVPQAELTLVLPSNCPGQESSRDLDSVPLDSSSLQDLKLGSEATCGPPHTDSTLPGHQGSLEFSSSLPPAFLPEEQPPPSPAHSINFSGNFAGFSSMRRGLTSLVTSIDSALTRDDSRSDAASTASSDSERYVVVGLSVETPDDADTAFREFEQGRRTSEQVEVAAEVVERSSSPSERSVTSSCRRRDLVSTCTWRVGNIHAVHQSGAGATAVRVIAADLKTDECSSIPWDELQSKFAMRSRAFAEQPPDVDSETVGQANPKIMMRLERNELPIPKESEPGTLAPYKELLKAHVRNLMMPLNMSTALALAEFAEDEIIQPPMPVELLIEDIKLHLVEDRPTRSISSPLPQPLDVALTSLVLCRDEEGVIRIGPAARPEPPPVQDRASAELVEAQARVGQLQRENEELRRRLARLARVSEDNRELRVRAEEAAVLREVAASSQQETAILLQDKDHLLETVRQLKEQLASGCLSRAGKR